MSQKFTSFKASNGFIIQLKFTESLALEEVCFDKTRVSFYGTSTILTHGIPHLELQVAQSTIGVVCCY